MKLPFAFSLKLVFRLLLPGFFLAAGIFPLIKTVLGPAWEKTLDIYVFTSSVIVLGWLLGVLDMPIYMAFEGRRYWPKFLRDLFVKRETARLERLTAKTKHKRNHKEDSRQYLEASVELRRFPMDKEGQYEVRYPTRLGNLLAAYEDYPERIYGMDAIFYWPRLWLVLDKDLREEIDGQQAIADSVIYTSTSLFICGLIFAVYAVFQSVGSELIAHTPGACLSWIIALVSLCLAFLTYRGSFHIHAQFGETFKSAFDIHQSKLEFDALIDDISELPNMRQTKNCSRKEKHRILWRYLHNYRVKVPGIDGTVSPEKLESIQKTREKD